jgi:hypothetical protein
MEAEYHERIASSGHIRAGDSSGDAWSGHLPITQRRLVSIMERAEAGAGDFSMAEQSLFVMCEFWAAVVARDLETLWRPSVDGRVEALISICAAIGLSEVAAALTAARRDLMGPLNSAQRRLRIRALEEQVLALNTPIDQLIGGFAQALAPASNARASWDMSAAL